MYRNSLISSPLSFPIVKPNDWNAWWDLWYTEMKFIPKIAGTHNRGQALWRGFDIYVKPGTDPLRWGGYQTKNVNCPELFSSLFDNIDDFPMDIHCMRVVSSAQPVTPHHDALTKVMGIRSLLYDNNVRPNFYYINSVGDKKYQTLPEDTNTWVYDDFNVSHGTDFYIGHSKLLIVYYGLIKEDMVHKNIDDNIHKYGDYVIYDNK
jgi:hypothetical protein